MGMSHCQTPAPIDCKTAASNGRVMYSVSSIVQPNPGAATVIIIKKKKKLGSVRLKVHV